VGPQDLPRDQGRAEKGQILSISSANGQGALHSQLYLAAKAGSTNGWKAALHPVPASSSPTARRRAGASGSGPSSSSCPTPSSPRSTRRTTSRRSSRPAARLRAEDLTRQPIEGRDRRRARADDLPPSRSPARTYVIGGDVGEGLATSDWARARPSSSAIRASRSRQLRGRWTPDVFATKLDRLARRYGPRDAGTATRSSSGSSATTTATPSSSRSSALAQGHRPVPDLPGQGQARRLAHDAGEPPGPDRPARGGAPDRGPRAPRRRHGRPVRDVRLQRRRPTRGPGRLPRRRRHRRRDRLAAPSPRVRAVLGSSARRRRRRPHERATDPHDALDHRCPEGARIRKAASTSQQLPEDPFTTATANRGLQRPLVRPRPARRLDARVEHAPLPLPASRRPPTSSVAGSRSGLEADEGEPGAADDERRRGRRAGARSSSRRGGRARRRELQGADPVRPRGLRVDRLGRARVQPRRDGVLDGMWHVPGTHDPGPQGRPPVRPEARRQDRLVQALRARRHGRQDDGGWSTGPSAATSPATS
jgi:hypothetical protein